MNNFEDSERFISSNMISEDVENEFSLRPKTMSEYVGQEKIKSNLNIYI
jgi:Holliday junction DNA helicase RuvB